MARAILRQAKGLFDQINVLIPVYDGSSAGGHMKPAAQVADGKGFADSWEALSAFYDT